MQKAEALADSLDGVRTHLMLGAAQASIRKGDFESAQPLTSDFFDRVDRRTREEGVGPGETEARMELLALRDRTISALSRRVPGGGQDPGRACHPPPGSGRPGAEGPHTHTSIRSGKPRTVCACPPATLPRRSSASGHPSEVRRELTREELKPDEHPGFPKPGWEVIYLIQDPAFPLEDLMTSEVRLSREMRLLDVTMIGVGAMIGAGIFVLTGIAAGVAGPALMVVFLLNGLVAFLTAAAYAELGSAIHGAGGGYLWIKASLPDPSGFLAGWMDWFAHAVACSLYALGFGAYFTELLHFIGIADFHTPLFPQEVWLAVLACTLFAVINYRGASEAGKAGNVVTIGKVAIIGVFIAAGLWVMVQKPDWQGSFDPFFLKGWGGIFAAMGLTFIAFEGYEIIAQTSEEVEDPKRNIPRAVFLSLLIVIPIYLLVAVVAIGAVNPPAGMAITDYLAQGGETALVSAADQFFVGGAIVILVGGLLSTVSALNATIYSSSRVAFAMARDASLPQVIARVHSRRGTPHFAILFSTILIIGMAVALPIEEVAAAASVMFLLLFGGVNIALIRLRKLRPDLDRGFKVPFVPFTPLLAVGTMLFIAVFMFVGYPLAWLAAGGWIVAGVVFYYAYSRSREAAYGERVGWMERLEKKQYRVLVAVSNPATVENLMPVAVAVAAKHAGEIVATSVVEVPEGESIFTGRRRTREMEPVLERCVEIRRITGSQGEVGDQDRPANQPEPRADRPGGGV